ncbi:MAG: prepilin-type N-terminal cleavage/methylation domain-containing protein [Planctomycetaceae bacterium]|nr:prepilin-type N-terminal cleavage/methylation domain-containing protein [Planctomycetaceae bacterium]
MRSRAFTLTELLIVIAVMAILATLLIPAASSLLGRVNETTCAGQLRAIGSAAALAQQEGKANGKISTVNWQVTLFPKVDNAAKVFLCPDGPVPVSESSEEDPPSAPVPGGPGIAAQYVLCKVFGGWGVWYSSDYAGWPIGGVPLDDDSPWIIHFSQHQRDTITAGDSYGGQTPRRYLGDPEAFWFVWYTDLNRWGPPSYIYEPDGTGVSYWALNVGWFAGRYCSYFMKTEPAAGGERLWTHWEAASAPGHLLTLISQASETVVTNKGPTRLISGAAFSMSMLHGLWVSETRIYPVPQPGQTIGDLTCGPGPLLINAKCQMSQLCPNYPHWESPCNGRDDWIVLGGGSGGDEGSGGADGSAQSGFNCTNYGMNSQAGSMSRLEQIFAMDYGDTVVKPEEDNWTAPTWDADGDGQVDFARHRGRVNALLVDGSVRSMAPADIDPQYEDLRNRFWMP